MTTPAPSEPAHATTALTTALSDPAGAITAALEAFTAAHANAILGRTLIALTGQWSAPDADALSAVDRTREALRAVLAAALPAPAAPAPDGPDSAATPQAPPAAELPDHQVRALLAACPPLPPRRHAANLRDALDAAHAAAAALTGGGVAFTDHIDRALVTLAAAYLRAAPPAPAPDTGLPARLTALLGTWAQEADADDAAGQRAQEDGDYEEAARRYRAAAARRARAAELSATLHGEAPLHLHAEGGRYSVLGPVHVKTPDGWVPHTLYAEAGGRLYARTPENFAARFTPLPEGVSRGS